uniref:BPTI/Kunitz inhibitor domain-containing protein n=1 Tax=Laticauda laticaudata TaxID=8630 RepID=A0A8C5RD54_LATLA
MLNQGFYRKDNFLMPCFILTVIFSSADLCTLSLEQGECSKFTLQWYYNQRVLECRPFIYSGCGGNSNRFSSKEDCEFYCKPQADTGRS